MRRSRTWLPKKSLQRRTLSFLKRRCEEQSSNTRTIKNAVLKSGLFVHHFSAEIICNLSSEVPEFGFAKSTCGNISFFHGGQRTLRGSPRQGRRRPSARRCAVGPGRNELVLIPTKTLLWILTNSLVRPFGLCELSLENKINYHTFEFKERSLREASQSAGVTTHDQDPNPTQPLRGALMKG